MLGTTAVECIPISQATTVSNDGTCNYEFVIHYEGTTHSRPTEQFLSHYKQFQLKQQQKLSSQCDVLPPPKFDFSFADPALGNIYELLKVTHLYLCASHSPVSSSLLHILQQFEQLAAHTPSTVAKYAVQTIQPSMIEQIPSTLQSSVCNFSTILVPSTDSTFCSAEVLYKTISSLLD